MTGVYFHRRVIKEIKNFLKEDFTNIQLYSLNDNDLKYLEANIEGSEKTPYEKGKFKISITIPDDYPFKPPKIKFNFSFISS